MKLTPLAMTLAIAGLAAPLAAQDTTGVNLAPAGTGTRGGVAQMALAQDLYALGMAQADALTVLAAARLASGVALTDVERELETTVGAGTDAADVADGPVDAAAMLDAARRLAGEDEVLAGLVEEAEADGARARTGAASRTLSRLPAGAVDTWKVPFFGNARAELAVLGDGDATLTVRVADENGNTVCDDAGGADRTYCDFIPAWNGYFVVTVRNAGAVRNSYHLLTN
ncbi:MAG: hypothetical protein ACT4OK_05575 [Gemmobacter sp.]